MQATTSAAGQAIERQVTNTTTATFPTRLNTAITVGRTDKTPRPASSPGTSGQDRWSRPATSGRLMPGMGSP